jgi:RNA polymerase sigma factor (sigma-70 family)
MPHTPDIERWFCEEVHVHRDVLSAWVRGRFPRIADPENLVEETMARVWRARLQGNINAPRALVFTIAHNLAVDQLRRDTVVPIENVAEMTELPVYESGPSPVEVSARNQELELLTEAIQALPKKCRQVLTLRKIYGLSQKEIAAQLGISEHTVEAQVGNGMRRCAAYFARRGLP